MALDDTIAAWRSLAFAWLGGIETHAKYNRFMRTLTGDRDVRGQRISEEVQNHMSGTDWTKFFRIEHIGAGARAEFLFLTQAIHRSMSDRSLIDDREVNSWLGLCEQTITNRRMGLCKETFTGYESEPTGETMIGLVPAESEAGDVICLIAGLDVPFVLRKLENGAYILVGEAYVHGVMYEDVSYYLFDDEEYYKDHPRRLDLQ